MRTLQGRFLLRPSRSTNELVVGVFARAQRRYSVQVCGLVVLSNHFHALLIVDSAHQLARFMNFVNGNLARKIGQRIHWRQKFWGGRYRSIPVSDEEAAQVDRLRYLLSQGVKEDLVTDPREWPGIHAATALLEGKPLYGNWLGQGAQGQRRGLTPSAKASGQAAEALHFSPLPCWRHLSEQEIQKRIETMIEEIVRLHRARRERTGITVLGPRRVRKGRRVPRRRVPSDRHRPAPLFHAATREVRQRLRRAYAEFLAAFRQAAQRFKAGELQVAFPTGSFPSARPFVFAEGA